MRKVSPLTFLFKAVNYSIRLNLTKRFYAIVLISAFLAPFVLLGPGQWASAKAASSTAQPSAPPSAPPEPFVIGTAEPSPVLFTSYLAAIGDLFSTPKLPEGFEMAKAPTFSNKISSYFGSFLG